MAQKPQATYSMPPNKSKFGTLIHAIVLPYLKARLYTVGIPNQIELPAPKGSKRVWSDFSGYIDLVIYKLETNITMLGRFAANLYELKPSNVFKYRTDYYAEVEHYAEHFPRYAANMQPISRAVVGESLVELERAHPLVFDTIVIETSLGAAFISYGPARDQRGPVDGLIVYNWGVQRRRPGERSIAEQRIEIIKSRLRVRLDQTAEAQVHGMVRTQLAAGAIIIYGMMLGYYSIIGVGTVGTAAIGGVAGNVGSTGTVIGGAGAIEVQLAAQSFKVANDIAPIAAEVCKVLGLAA